MSSKKYTLLALVMCFTLNGVFAQMAGTPDFSDSSKVRPKLLAQQNEWANGLASSPFPAKPRDAWQLGVFGGTAGIFGDVTSFGWNAGISARKSIGYVVSVRPSISYSNIKGLAYENQYSLANLPKAVNTAYTTAGLNSFVPSFETELITPSLDFLVSLNNIMFHKKQSNWNYYLLVGYSPMSYKTNMDALDANGSPYTYAGIDFTGKRSDIKDQLDNLLDGTYETDAITRSRRQNFNEGGEGKRQWRHSVNVGGGFERRLGDIVTLSGEVKYTLSGDDFIDGIAYAAPGMFTSGNDALMFANLGFNFNLGLKSRKKFLQQAGKDDAPAADLGQFPGNKVAPLWMMNPLGQPYGELSNPTRMNMPKSWLEDSDSDGVPDQFDLEPNTPAGAPVDTRGRSRDTDGDGVPDYLDKELITPTSCQPVNADGVGTCPDPKCCTDRPPVVESVCNIGSLPSVQFSGSSSRLASGSNAILDAAAEQIKANPTCKICVVGHGGSSKREQQLSWDRVNSVINYMVETKGISRDRFVFKYGEAGDANTVDLQDCTGEEGPNTVPAPHPQYRSTK
jgi:OmpA-OmpF porin, OOP family